MISGGVLASRPSPGLPSASLRASRAGLSASTSGDRGEAGPGAFAFRGVRTASGCRKSTSKSWTRCSGTSPRSWRKWNERSGNLSEDGRDAEYRAYLESLRYGIKARPGRGTGSTAIRRAFRSFYRLRPTRSTLPSFDTVFDLPFDGLRTPLRMLRTGLWASHLVAQADLQRFFEKRCVRKRNPAIL